MAKTINIAPLTRIEGHASIAIQLDDAGNVADSKVHFQSLRGFEKFVEGKPAEELPRIDEAARAWTRLGADLAPTTARVIGRMSWVELNLQVLDGVAARAAERLPPAPPETAPA